MAGRRKQNGNGSAQTVEARLDALANDMAALQKDVRGLARASGDYAVRQVDQAVTDARQQAAGAYDRVGAWADGNIEALRESVREQPLSSWLFSLGAGALIGAFLLRR